MDQNTGGLPVDVSMDDRRWALLAYLFTPVVPLLLQMTPEVRNRPFIRAHLAQAMALGVLQVALLVLTPFTFCLSTVAFLLLYVAIFYWGIQAYNGQYVQIPWVTDYVRKQGWA